jgi:hypothetical protein
MLNDPWSVGYVTTLIELKQFRTKEEWEEFYYEMGEYRIQSLNNLPTSTVELLEDEQLVRTDRSKVNQLSPELKGINTQNGRTREQLARKGKILYDNVKSTIADITLEECIECVRFRVICETWNGIIVREKNTINTLKGIFPDYYFDKKDGDFDHQYAVDYEMKKDSEIICGIQIKPISYTFNTPYLNRAKSANFRKNAAYSERFGKQVFDIISKSNGEIQNPEIIEQIEGLIE